jgi:WD40 repeat protein
LYDIVSKEEIGCLRGHLRPVVSIERHPSLPARIASGSPDGTIKIWD